MRKASDMKRRKWDALINTIPVWEIPNESIVGISWDTTTSNTEHLTSASLFKQEMERGIFWLACRHHIRELSSMQTEAGSVWTAQTDRLFNDSRSIFKLFQ